MKSALQEKTYLALVDRLNKQSAEHHYKAYGDDIAWDDPKFAIRESEAFWQSFADETPFLKVILESLKDKDRSNDLIVHALAHKMKVGIQFENTLQRGLLELANILPNNSSEFRYAHHEIVEESQHSMIFQEFINRSGKDVVGLPAPIMRRTHRIAKMGRTAPNLFMFFVLLGEAPIDYEQKRVLKNENLPPIVERIFHIHTSEESRHIGFAAAYLKKNVPELSAWRRYLLGAFLPPIAFIMSMAILSLPLADAKKFGFSFQDWLKALRDQRYRLHVNRSLLSIKTLAKQLGLMHSLARWLWSLMDKGSKLEAPSTSVS
jgi:hypothetical protein